MVHKTLMSYANKEALLVLLTHSDVTLLLPYTICTANHPETVLLSVHSHAMSS